MKYFYFILLVVFQVSYGANIKPAEGFWRTSDDPAVGSGLMITTQNKLTLISVFTYDDAGKSIWYTASDEIDEQGHFEANLFKTAQGSHILSDSVQSAQAIDTGKVLKINFTGTQSGELTVDGGQVKIINAYYYGVETWEAEQLSGSNGNTFLVPDLSGKWIQGSIDSESANEFELVRDEVLPNDDAVIYDVVFYRYGSNPSKITCPKTTSSNAETNFHECRWDYFEDDGIIDERFSGSIKLADIGSSRMLSTINQNAGDEDDGEYQYEAFKIEEKPLAHNGHWRTTDDPQIGSGMYITTQRGITVVVLYTYEENGDPIWQIATGTIDETDNFNAKLISTGGGTPFYHETQSSATILDNHQNISLKFNGAEIGQLSIDDSAIKSIQNYNFGVNTTTTQQFKLDGMPISYPSVTGKWLVYKENDYPFREPIVIEFLKCVYPSFDSNCTELIQANHAETEVDFHVSPYVESIFLGMSFGFIHPKYGIIECLTTMNAINRPYCQGGIFGGTYSTFGGYSLKFFFEDIGAESFTGYIDDNYPPHFHHINRNNDKVRFFRLSE